MIFQTYNWTFYCYLPGTDQVEYVDMFNVQDADTRDAVLVMEGLGLIHLEAEDVREELNNLLMDLRDLLDKGR